jgi:excisionase family DNA binding protein
MASEKQAQPYTIEEAAKVLGLPLQSVYNLARRNELPGTIRLGKRLFVSRKKLDALVDGEHPAV